MGRPALCAAGSLKGMLDGGALDRFDLVATSWFVLSLVPAEVLAEHAGDPREDL